MARSSPGQPRVMESITDAADSSDELAHLLPQAFDLDLDRPLQHDGVLANGRVLQSCSGLMEHDRAAASLWAVADSVVPPLSSSSSAFFRSARTCSLVGL